MTAKHTPGPWRVVVGPKYNSHITATNGFAGPGGIINVTLPRSIAFPSSAEGQANARLIAAAPEMLAALRAFVETCDGWAGFESRVERGKSAIAAATGETA